jgi:hypothetical protein
MTSDIDLSFTVELHGTSRSCLIDVLFAKKGASSALQQLLLDIGVDPHPLATSEHNRTTVKYHALNLVPGR